jgi:CheY-like chemotaxis protein
MPPEVAARAFDPFYTTKPIGKGTGLGLTQAFGLARRAGGTARIESAPGEGTTVKLILPLAEQPPAQQIVPVPRSASKPDRRVTALVVDDDADVLETLSALLDQLGVGVRRASGGAAALAVLDGFEPDLLLVDFAMPEIDGADVARAAQRKYPDVPIVFVTGYSDSEAIERSAGRNALVLRKPFRESELHAAVARALAFREGGSTFAG